MKNLIRSALGLALLAGCLTINTHAAAPLPGYIHFGPLASPGPGAEVLEIKVQNNLLSLAAKLVESDQPDLARILRSVVLIQGSIVAITDVNREALLKQVKSIRATLENRDWDRNVAVTGQEGEDIGVYTRTRNGDALAGVAITIVDAKSVVLVNIVGDIRPDQLAALGGGLHLQPLQTAGAAIKK